MLTSEILGENKDYMMILMMSMRYIDNPYTYIYKVFRNFDIFSGLLYRKYFKKNWPTKIQYIYSNSQETRDISKLETFL